MSFRAVRSWTLGELIVAFVELAVAYTLLCGSAFAFIPSKILSLFGLYLPCPCRGFFGYQNYNLCFHRLLIDWPRRTVIAIQELAKSRFPFDLIWFEHQSCELHVEGFGIGKYANEIIEMEGEACSSSVSGPTWQSSVDKESGCDSKGKKIMNQKQKSGIRRRRRASLAYGKFSPALSATSTSNQPVGAGVNASSGLGREFCDSLDPGRSLEACFQGDRNARNSTDSSESIRRNFEFNGSYGYGQGKDSKKDSLSVEKFTCNATDRLCSVGNDANVIRLLEQALEEEKAARAALYLELEQERSAAATAADEAMAMILRLQEDKASIVMEARQYRREIEEKCVYDEEEMNILKEILVRREKEIHFLEKEVEAYEQLNFLGNEQVESDSNYQINDKEQAHPLSGDSNLNPPSVPQQIENSSVGDKGVGTSGKELVAKELASDISTSLTWVQQTVSLAGMEETERDIRMISPATKAPQNYGTIEAELEQDGKHQSQVGCNMHGSMLDTESTVYDVHVVDDTERVQNSKLLIDCLTGNMAEIKPVVHGSGFDVNSRSIVSGNPLCKTFNFDRQRRSPSPVDGERLKIDNEVEWLRERLRIVQEEKEKLSFSAEHRERINAQLKLVEDVVNQFQEIQRLREPMRHASLPPSSSKASLKKRHHRSASYEES